MATIEQVVDRGLALEHARRQGWGPVLDDETDKVEAMERELKWHAQQRDRLIAASSDPREASRIWTIELGRFDGGQRLRMLKGTLIERGLADASAVQDIETLYRDAEREQQAREAARESQALQGAIDAVLAATSDKQEALNVYNSLGDVARSWDKVNTWCRELVGKRLLSAEWLPGAKLGNKLHDFRKALHVHTANKALEGPGYDK